MKKTITIALAVVLCLALFSGCSISVSLDYDNADKYTMGGATLEAEITRVDIGWISGEVNVVYNDSDKVEFSETANMDLNDEDTLYYWLDGETLHINFAKSGYITIENLQKTLTLSIPEGTELAELEVDSVSGDVNADGIAAEEFQISTVSGEISAEGIKATRACDFDSVSGRINASVVGSLEKLKVDTVSGSSEISVEELGAFNYNTTSGDINLTCGNTPTQGDVDSVSGHITLCLPENAGFTARVDTVSGDFSSDIPAKLDSDDYICGDGSADFDLGTVSGDIDIKINDKAATASPEPTGTAA